MINRNLVTSGFDTETLVSEGYLTYTLLAQIEAGLFPLEFAVVDPVEGVDVNVIIHPPQDYERLYDEEPSAPLPTLRNGSFAIELLPDNGSPIASVAFNPDGMRMATGSWDGQLRLWDVENRRELRRFDGHATSITSVAFSPDGTRIASASVDGTVRVWDVESGVSLSTFTGHSGPIFVVAISPDGIRVASGGSDRMVRVWDLESGAELITLIGHTGPLFGMDFSPDGTRITSGGLDTTVRVWDLESGDELTIFDGHSASVSSVAFSPDGTHIASGSKDGTVRLWDVEGSGDPILFVNGRAITSVAFSPDGTRIASGSEDRTARVWDVESGDELVRFTGHRKPVLSVAFTHDGTRVASGAQDEKVRLWDSENGQEASFFTVPFMHLTLFVTVIDNNTGERFDQLPAGLQVDLEIEANDTDSGLEVNHALRFSLVRLDDATATLLEARGIDPSATEDRVRAQLDRRIPLGVAQNLQVQQIRMRKFVDGDNRSLGFYVDLALRSGPEPDAYHPPRGNTSLAQDFRADNQPLAFATSHGLFDLLGPDLKFRQTEESPEGSGEFRYPLRREPLNPDSDEIGKIKGITVGPEVLVAPNVPPVTTGRLMIDIHGEYTDAPGDPDFHLQLFFNPKVKDGIVDWDLDVDIDFGLLATLLLLAAGIGLMLLFGPALSWGSTLFVGAILGLAVLKGLIVEPLAAKLIEDHLDEDADASFLEALPYRTPAARRRWDPFYVTHHQIVTLVDQVLVDTLGIAFEGTATKLDKQPEPVDHVVIRDEQRSNDLVMSLRYRVRDFDRIIADLEANAPGRDRMDFDRADPNAEPTLVTLNTAQIAERIAANRLYAPRIYTAQRIHVVDNQIDGLLCLSRLERGEQRDRLIREWRARERTANITNFGDQLMDQAIAELEEELGRPPIDDEIADRFDRIVNGLVNERQSNFEANLLPDRLEEAVAQVLRFDLAPEEFAEQQRARVLLLDPDKEIITRRNADGTTTAYYRDHPDSDPRDNLLALPHYTPPYQPPE